MSFQFEKYPMNYSGIPSFLCSLIYCVISVWVSPVYAEYTSTTIVNYRYFRFLLRKCIYLYCLLIVNRFVVFFLCSLIYCVISVWVSAVYAKYASTPIHPVEFPQKNQFPKKPGFPLSTLIILDWYSYVSLFPDLLCNIGLSVSGLRKMRFNAYTPRRNSTTNQFPKKPGFPSW